MNPKPFIRLHVHYIDGSKLCFRAQSVDVTQRKIYVVELDGTHHDLDKVNVTNYSMLADTKF